jgi:hypothetical protein
VINIMGILWPLLLTSYQLFFCQLGDSQISIRGKWCCEDLRNLFTLRRVSVLKMVESCWSRSNNSEIFLQRKDIFSLLQRAKSGSEPYHTSSLMGTGDSFSFSGCISGGAWGSRLLSSVEFRNKWSYTSTPPYAFIAFKDMSVAHKLLENNHSTFGLASAVRCLEVQKMNTTSQKEDLSLCQGKRWHELNLAH